MRRAFLITTVVIVVAAGIGAGVVLVGRGNEQSTSEALDEALRRLETTDIPVGLAPSPPSPLQAGWETNFAKRLVPLAEFSSGGPGKDGIPAIDAPQFAPASETSFLRPREPVIELTVGKTVRGYPIQILIWHEIVNDEVAGIPMAVTFCPLCNTAIVFNRRVGDRVLDFGTTGNLRYSDLVMYDRQTESWWQQFSGEAIVGELTGTRLEQLPARIVSWAEFRRDHPGAKVLSRRTGYDRAYGENPYVGYDDASSPPFFATANQNDRRLPPKERVVYLEDGKEAVAVPFSLLRKRREVKVEIGGREFVVLWSAGVTSALDSTTIAEGADIGSAQVLENGRSVPFHEPFWFAVAAFRPDVRIVR